MDLDRIDHAILDRLRGDGRVSATELAEAVGLSPSACSRRLRRLEEGRAILGYGAQIDDALQGLRLSVLVFVTLEGQTEEQFSRFEKSIGSCSNVVEGYLLAGQFDYCLRVVARDVADFERVHKEQLSRLPGVSRIQSNFTLRKVAG